MTSHIFLQPKTRLYTGSNLSRDRFICIVPFTTSNCRSDLFQIFPPLKVKNKMKPPSRTAEHFDPQPAMTQTISRRKERESIRFSFCLFRFSGFFRALNAASLTRSDRFSKVSPASSVTDWPPLTLSMKSRRAQTRARSGAGTPPPFFFFYARFGTTFVHALLRAPRGEGRQIGVRVRSAHEG